ncbi:hypothetical protein A9W95_25650 [Mycobacterium sp. 1423905.2]|nr:hypothetical protein A9W95_25650 [Mycobacterium sp. 1423905.2]
MKDHACLRCGFDCRRDSWAERHPTATAVIAVPTIWTVISVTLAYPWFFIPVLIVAAAWWVDRRQRRRTAIAARADYEHRVLIARELAQREPRQRRRGADQRSPTQPLRRTA